MIKNKTLLYVILFIESLFLIIANILFIIEKNNISEENFATDVLVDSIDMTSSYVKVDDKLVNIKTNLLNKDDKIYIEGKKIKEEVYINKISLDFLNSQNKKDFIKEKLLNNSKIRDYYQELKVKNGEVIGIVPIMFENITYAKMVEPEELRQYSDSAIIYNPSALQEKITIAISYDNEWKLEDIKGYSEGKYNKVKYIKDDSVTFEKDNSEFYVVTLYNENNKLQYILLA